MQLENRYTALNMFDLVSLAENDMAWMVTAFHQLYKEVLSQKEHLESKGDYYGQLENLINMVEMFSYTAEHRHNETAHVAKEYEQEFEAEQQRATNAIRSQAQVKACELQH